MRNSFLSALDRDMHPYAPKMRDDVRVEEGAIAHLATTLSGDIDKAGDQLRTAVRRCSPLNINRRLQSWHHYRLWRTEIEPHLRCPDSNISLPAQQRERLMASAFAEMCILLPHLYMGFVYPSDTLFDALYKSACKGSTLRRCAGYLRDAERRSLRNAVAHGNWYFDSAAQELIYYARKGDDQFDEFRVTMDHLKFLLKLSQCVAWTSLLALDDHEDNSPA